MAPARPLSPAPLPMHTAPLLDILAKPELNSKRPLPPSRPVLTQHSEIAPELVVVLSPPQTSMEPPVETSHWPEYSLAEPPNPLVPLPIAIDIEPVAPPVA